MTDSLRSTVVPWLAFLPAVLWVVAASRDAPEIVARAYRTRGFGDWWGHILVAEGRCDDMIEGRVALHDVAAWKPILEEAGGVLLTRNNAPLVRGFEEATLSSAPGVAEELSGILGF